MCRVAQTTEGATASRGRMIAARVLVIVGGLVVVLSLIAGYIRFQALDNGSVRTFADQLIADDQVRDQIATTLVDQLYANVDVGAALQQQLPKDQQALSGLIASGLREFSDRAAQRLLENPRAQEAWVNTIAFSHQQLLNVLEDDVRGTTTENGAVFLDLRPLIIQLGERVPLVARIAQQLPNDSGRIKIIDADQLETAQDLTQLMKVLGAWLWVVPVLLWALALWLARGRRRAILRAIAWTSMLAGLLVLVVRHVAGGYVVDSLAKTEAVKPAAQDAWNILTHPLSDGGWTLLGLGAIVLFAGWLAGDGRIATSTRTELAPFIARWEISYGVALVLFLLLLLWQPTIQTTRVPLMLAAAIVLGFAVELLRRQVLREHPEAADMELGAYTRDRFARARGR
jgi:hypothetical protein